MGPAHGVVLSAENHPPAFGVPRAAITARGGPVAILDQSRGLYIGFLFAVRTL